MLKIKLICGNHSDKIKTEAHADNPLDPKCYLCDKGCENELSEQQYDAMIKHIDEVNDGFVNLSYHEWKRGRVTFRVLEHTTDMIVVEYINRNKVDK